MELPIFTTGRLIVRLADIRDIGRIQAYFAREAEFLAPFSPTRPNDFLTDAYWHDRVAHNRFDLLADRALRLFLFDRTTGEVAGTCSFTQIERGPAQYCTLGFGLGAASQGRGLMVEALVPAIDYVFDTLRLHRIMANHLPHNTRSSRLLRKLGFVEEGYARQYLRINGQWADHVLTSLTNPNWRDEKTGGNA